ncbi:MAG TPA: hypothetical protein VJQ56_14965 [Blastocatellia bacterium]|nr:hypothetical protein [Blastocatellia bacterium]
MSKKKAALLRKSLLAALAFISLSASASGADLKAERLKVMSLKAEGLNREIVAARELIFQGDYDRAQARFAEMSRSHPARPEGDFYQAVAFVWKSYVDAKLDSGSRNFDAQINDLLTSAIRKAEAIRARADKSEQEADDALYYLGSAYAMRSRVSFYQNHGVPAARQARTAQDHLNALIRTNPEYWDAYFALGSIYYRAGALMDSSLARLASAMLGAKALPSGDRERGLEYLKKAADRSTLAGVDAKLALLEIYALTESRFDQSLTLARQLAAAYPHNQTFARYLLRSYAGLKDRRGLTQTARAVLARVKEAKAGFGLFMRREADRYLAEARKL